jgi:hypothetical protein
VKLFKERILIVFYMVLFYVAIIVVGSGISIGLEVIHPGLSLGVSVLIIILLGLILVATFINWLFVEPFRKGKTK